MKQDQALDKVKDTTWKVVTFAKPCIWTRHDPESWLFNPGVRYVLPASQVTRLVEVNGIEIDSCSDLAGCSQYRPLNLGANLAGARIRVERYRDRGIGDLLFMTGPMRFIQHMAGHSAKIHFYALSDRGQALDYNPDLACQSTLSGPSVYDTFGNYDYQWMSGSVTEYSEEVDQPNVYDALYTQLGIDPGAVPAEFKRPSVTMHESDFKNLDTFYYLVHSDRKIDLRQGYYVVAPLARSTLRSLPYGRWIEIITEMSKQRPVVVVGDADTSPNVDMGIGEFHQRVSKLGPRVINMIGMTKLRPLMSIIARAKALVCLDSGLLYVAQGLNVPAISIWGTHDPRVRIGYDADYMENAIWDQGNCRHAPCFAYLNFPHHKCPQEREQVVCECLKTPGVDAVFSKLQKIEQDTGVIEPVKPA